MNIIGNIITMLITDILEGLLELLGEFLFNLTYIGLYPERELSNMGFDGLEKLKEVFLYTGISLLVLKFLKKGIDIYMLGTDGDPDSDPIMLVTNFVKALVISLTFTEIYEWFANVITSLTDKSIKAIGLGEGVIDLVFLTDFVSQGLFVAIFILVYMVFYLSFYIKFLQIGLQVLILRTGMPLACSGLMDADKGTFRPYVQKFLQIGVTVLVQIVLAKLSLAFLLSRHLLWAFASLIFAIKTPRFLQEFLIVSEGSGGGGIYKAQSGVRLVQSIRSFVK